MAKLPWLKLYTEIRTDPKMQALNDLEFRTWINILCLSAESKVRGIICIEKGLAYPIEGLARTLFISTEELASCLNKFQKLRMIDLDQDGIITVINFDDRQQGKPSDSPAEVKKRVDKCRAKKRNANVTPLKREENAIEEDKEGDIDKDLDNNNNNSARGEIEPSANDSEETVSKIAETTNELSQTVSKPEETRPMDLGTRAVVWAEKNWGRLIPKGEADMIIASCDDLLSRGSPDPDAVVIEAMKCCIIADVRKISYLNKVLIDWTEAGILTVDQARVRSSEHKSKSQKDHNRNKDPGDKPSSKTSEKYKDFYL